jgi:D5-like protein
VWIRVEGEYPRPGKLVLAGKPWGEWRADGHQTVIHGRHPSGRDYTNNNKRPLEIEFSEINWLEGLELPWEQRPPFPEILSEGGAASGGAFTSNDAGRADRFVSRFCAEIRFVPEREIWLAWDESRWRVDRDGSLERLAIKLSRDLLAEASQIPGVDDAATKKRSAACAEALACGDRRNISDFLALAKVDRRILLPVTHLDNNPWLIGARNAVIELKTGTIREYSRDDYITRTLGCDVDPQATCPTLAVIHGGGFP